MKRKKSSVQVLDSPKKKKKNIKIAKNHRIIGIGASAGGLEALKDFFENVPDDFNHSFVIVQHLSPDYKSMMAELLAKNTDMPIFETTNGMVVKRGCAYLIPPKKNMTISGDTLILVDKPSRQDLNLPIDIFFLSLAEAYKENAIAIILSGTGSDGTSGARSIKELGGMVMVQDPEQAKFDGMPLSALSTGLVDYTLPVEQLPAELLEFIEHPGISDTSDYLFEKDEITVNRILHQIRLNTQLDFENYKRPTLSRRISRRISVNKFSNHLEYLEYLFENPSEVNILTREFLIGVTNFFRDPYAWETLVSKSLPDLIRSKAKNDIFKVWCVGTSTGEEAYSMAIVISEELERQDRFDLRVKIFASDLSNDHLAIGGKGIYPESIVANVSSERLKKFFIKKGDQYQIIDLVRRMVIFSQHNVLRDPPFNKMDIVACRNLLIYMQVVAQKKIIGLLHYSLNLNGILFLGSSESLGDYSEWFKEINRKSKIYQNIRQARKLGIEPLRYPDIQKLSPTQLVSGVKTRSEIRMSQVMNEALSEELGLAGVYVDENYNIYNAIGEFKKFMKLPEKGFSVNLLKMLPPNIAISVGTAVRKAHKADDRVFYKSMKIEGKKNPIYFDLLVEPFDLNENEKGSLLLFIPKEEQKGKALVVEKITGLSGRRIDELEEELSQTRLDLGIVVQEVETSNTELQATNEELLAANEELQSTNEELQSVNEELHTVNAELQDKIEDLAALNADMDNLLDSTEIGTIFIDREMRIRKFTPNVTEHFSLQDSDIDRPIHHFSSNFDSQNSTFDRVRHVLSTGESLQKEIKTREGRWFLKKITPYKNSRKKIDGAVISFVDIHELKLSEEKIRKSEKEFRLLYENAPDMFFSADTNGNIINCNLKFISKLGFADREDAMGRHITELYSDLEIPKFKARLKELKKTGSLSNAEREIKHQNGSLVHVSANGQAVLDSDEKPLYFLFSFKDITEITKTKRLLEDKNDAFQLLLEGTMAGYWDWKIQENTEYLSPTFKEMFGYKDDEMENRPEAWQKIIHPDDLPNVLEQFNNHVASKGKLPFDNQVRYYHKDGSIVWVYCRGKVIEWDKKGKPIRMVGCHVDITPLKITEQELHRSNNELEQFAYIASHDLQEPLNTITEFVKLFEKEYKSELDENANQYLEFIIQAALRMSSLVKGVLSYSRIGRNAEVEEVDCNEIIEEVKVDLGSRIRETKAVIKTSELPIVLGYRTEIHSLFLNFMSNGIKFRKANRAPQISIKSSETSTHWKFIFTDNGMGISKKHKDKIFNIFQRLNNMDSFEGTGIGLAQCKKIVEHHNGEITVNTNLKQGSAFHFTLKKLNL